MLHVQLLLSLGDM